MNKDWIPLITTLLAVLGTLFGVLIGGCISSLIKWFEIKNQKSIESNKLKLSKFEELYQMLYKHPINFIDSLEQRAKELESNFDAPSFQILDFSVEKLDMIIEFYIPELNPNLEKLVKLEKELADEYFIYKVYQYKQINNVRDRFQKLNLTATSLLAKFKDLDIDIPKEQKEKLNLIREKLVSFQKPMEEILGLIPHQLANDDEINQNRFFKKFKEVEAECKKMQDEIVKLAQISIKTNNERSFLKL